MVGRFDTTCLAVVAQRAGLGPSMLQYLDSWLKRLWLAAHMPFWPSRWERSADFANFEHQKETLRQCLKKDMFYQPAWAYLEVIAVMRLLHSAPRGDGQ